MPEKDKITQDIGEWIYLDNNVRNTKNQYNRYKYDDENLLTESLTKGAVQKNWKTKTIFRCCPSYDETRSLGNYCKKLEKGELFCINDLWEATIKEFNYNVNRNNILLITESNFIKPYALVKLTFEDNLFVHETVRTFFSSEDAQKYCTLEQGLEWAGEDPIDDYC